MKKANSKSSREPSLDSLKAMPEIDFTKAKQKRNPYAKRIAKNGIAVHVIRGRPPKGTETGSTTPRSIRFSSEIWKTLEDKAKSNGMTLHSALRAAVLHWVSGSPGAMGKTTKKW
jgi:hypothetical protein